MARLPLSVSAVDDVPKATGEKLIAMAESASSDGLRVELGGQVIENSQQAEVSSEMVGLAIAAIVLLLTFGTLIAAGLPLATALFGLGISSAIGGVLAAVIDTPDWSAQVAAMIGIGVGIDYALLILTRFRGALAAGSDAREATVEAVSTAGRSSLIAGGTVVISLMGLFLMGLPYNYGVALAAIAAVVTVMAASVTLLPALLGFARERVNKLRVPGTGRAPADPSRAPAARWSRLVQRRPWAAALAGVGILLALAAPVLGLRLGFPDAGNDAKDTTTRQAYDLQAKGFGAGSSGPLLLVADARRSGRPGSRGRAVADAGRRAGRGGGRGSAVQRRRRHRRADGHPGRIAAVDRDRGSDPHAARRRAAAQRPARGRRRRDRVVRRPGRDHRGAAAAVHRRRARPLVPAPAGGLPRAGRGGQGRRDEPAVDRRGLRSRGAGGRRRLRRARWSGSARRPPSRRSCR